MSKIFDTFNLFLSRRLNRCKYCKFVLYIIDDSHAVCLNCGSYFVSSSPKPTSLFNTCSATSRGKDNDEI